MVVSQWSFTFCLIIIIIIRLPWLCSFSHCQAQVPARVIITVVKGWGKRHMARWTRAGVSHQRYHPIWNDCAHSAVGNRWLTMQAHKAWQLTSCNLIATGSVVMHRELSVSVLWAAISYDQSNHQLLLKAFKKEIHFQIPECISPSQWSLVCSIITLWVFCMVYV